MHLVNRILASIASSSRLPTNSSGKYYKWQFGSLYYEKHGAGAPILLVHNMAVESSSHEWSEMVNALSKTRTVYTIDLLGCGHSDKPDMVYTGFLYTQMILSFIKSNIGAACDIVASKSSAPFVLAAAASDTDAIRQIILINPVSPSVAAEIPNKKTKLLMRLIGAPVKGTFVYNVLCGIKTLQFQDPQSKYLFASIMGRYTTLNIDAFASNINNSLFIIEESCSLSIAEDYKNLISSAEIIKLEEPKLLTDKISSLI